MKDKKEGQCQQRSGCRTSVTMTAARAQRAAEPDEDGHWIGFGHIPEALHHTPRMVVFAHLSSSSYSASPKVCFPGCRICFPPRKDYSSAHSQPCHQHQGESFCLPAGPEALRTTGYETQELHTQIPWKVDRACPACASRPSVPNTPHLLCTYLEKQKSMLKKGLDCEPLQIT